MTGIKYTALVFTILFFMFTVMQGCSYRNWYEGSQQYQRSRCYGLDTPEQNKCLENTGKNYDEYEMERGKSR